MVNHISFLVPSLRGGGAERVMLNLANALCEKYPRVDFVTFETGGPLRDQAIPALNMIQMGTDRASRSWFAFTRYLRQCRPDVVISALENGNQLALAAKLLVDRKLIVIPTIHSTYTLARGTSESMFKWRIIQLAGSFTYRAANAIVAVSDGARNDFLALYGLNRDKVETILNPVVGESLFRQAEEPFDHRWLMDRTVPVVVSHGRLTRAKNFPVLIQAIKIVNETIPVRLIILGEGEERPTLEKLISENGLDTVVDLLGFRPNPYCYLKKADLYVLSSDWEGLPTALIEALALDVPVVATDCPSGPAEILGHGRYGALVPPGDPVALAVAMIAEIRMQPGQRERFDYAKYAVTTAASRYAELIRKCA